MNPIKPCFLHKLALIPLDDGSSWKLDHNFSFYSAKAGLINVPKGFETDLASIPRLLWSIYPPFGKYIEAAIIHDYLYRTQTTTRKLADEVLYEAMKLCSCSSLTCNLFYYHLKVYGWLAWNSNTKKYVKTTSAS